MNLNINQVLAIALAVLSATSGAATQLTDAGLAVATVKMIVGLSGFGATIIAAVLAAILGQAGLVKTVAAMPGVEAVTVNTQANQVLASVATDPLQDKVKPVPGARPTLEAKAKEA